jgi:hypothetical protein
MCAGYANIKTALSNGVEQAQNMFGSGVCY